MKDIIFISLGAYLVLSYLMWWTHAALFLFKDLGFIKATFSEKDLKGWQQYSTAGKLFAIVYSFVMAPLYPPAFLWFVAAQIVPRFVRGKRR